MAIKSTPTGTSWLGDRNRRERDLGKLLLSCPAHSPAAPPGASAQPCAKHKEKQKATRHGVMLRTETMKCLKNSKSGFGESQPCCTVQEIRRAERCGALHLCLLAAKAERRTLPTFLTLLPFCKVKTSLCNSPRKAQSSKHGRD